MAFDPASIHLARADAIATASLAVETSGEGFIEITREVARFLDRIKARDGVVLLYLRHTSASLVIQENADPDVRTDLVTALRRLAPANAGWVHEVEGPDDMPAHIKSMLNGVSLHVPVAGGEDDARRLAGHLRCRTSRAAAPARSDAAIHRGLRAGVTAAPMKITKPAYSFSRLPASADHWTERGTDRPRPDANC